MKTNKIMLLAVLLITVVACKYDDDALWDKVNSLDDRVTSIEARLTQMNSDINALSVIVNALQNKVYVESVTETENGYQITFTDGKTITIKDGKDGEDAPVISVEEFEGKYYWIQIVNGNKTWLTDKDGNKLPVTGADAITPILKVSAEGYWLISYDRGITFESLLDESGNPVKAVGQDGQNGQDGDSFFDSVTVEDGVLIIVLKDGTVLRVPIENSEENGISQYAKDLGLSEVAVNQDANSSEICYFVKQNGDSITLVGDKDEDGCVSSIYLMKYNTATEKLTTRFDEQMRPILLTYNNSANITFDWIDSNTAIVKAYDPETNTYITTTWNSEETPQTKMTKFHANANSNLNTQRNGNLKLTIKDRVPEETIQTRATPVEDLSDQYCVFSVTQCGYPKDASTWISLSNANTHKFIENLYYYKKASTGVYYYRIPAGSYPSKATNKDLCTKIDWGLSTLQVGLTWLAGFSSVADAISLVCASTGLGVPPAAILKTLTVATIAGAVSLEIFMDANGTSGLMAHFNPDWYYKEYVVSDLILSPYVITPTDVINCEKQRITPEAINIRVNCDIDGDPTIDSFTLNPDFPAAGQSYVASATFHCVPIGSTITMSIVGTDGYTDSETTVVNTTSGVAELWVPGAETGVRDVCKIVINTPDGNTITMTASLVFGY